MGTHDTGHRRRSRNPDPPAGRRSLNRTTLPLRESLAALNAEQAERFQNAERASVLVRERAEAVDGICRSAFAEFFGSECGSGPLAAISLIAVGGYGRGELHPCSDVDLMLLVAEDATDELRGRIESLVAFLWDCGLEVGHSVRTVAQCVTEAERDITVATNLMESRPVAGSTQLYHEMRAVTGPDRVWPGRAFFEAKWAEQQARHARYHDTAYKLEPNVKESPGGLRDIQMIGWVAKRHFGVATLAELVGQGFLTEGEYEQLSAGQDFLWQVRFALHVITGRREDRLLFDHQQKLAKTFGYRDAGHSLAVEQFMQRYYRAIIDLSRLNEVLLQLFQEAILHAGERQEPAPINPRFEEVNGFLQITHPRVFEDTPSALLEIFHLLQQNPHLKGVRAETIRLLLRARDSIDDAFRADPANRELFMAILREPVGITHELRRMNRYGILGRYIPVFGRIVGRMQYDLFHAYTVDEHTLFVVSNLRRFALPRFDSEFPFASSVMQGLAKPELAYIAGLFHDIAKGRGGDHSELGASDAENFCAEHGLSRYDTRVVSWLVQNHLLLSITAQKKDISDPIVIHGFAAAIGDQAHLDYLFVLTCADVRGTNPDLWNSWKRSLFEDLYRQTRRALRRGLENPIDKDELVAETRNSARALCALQGFDSTVLDELWSGYSDDYFLQHTPDEIAWHASALVSDHDPDATVVLVRQTIERGGTAVFVHAAHDPGAFARATAVLDQLRLTVMDARLVPDRSGRSLATYIVLEADGEPITGRQRIEEIQYTLHDAMRQRGAAPRPVTRRAPRKIRAFQTPTQVTFTADARNDRTVVELVSGDRPGLLAEIGKTFADNGVAVQTAKITTVGERVEDVFFVTGPAGRALDGAAEARLEQALLTTLTAS
ncbi:MAG: [protein-PII] uridylyltransferase [Xanthomonadaceae bacterium]|nr:[protein-PII] uridylyltransferase [Xanthomonadaceae bacterium]